MAAEGQRRGIARAAPRRVAHHRHAQLVGRKPLTDALGMRDAAGVEIALALAAARAASPAGRPRRAWSGCGASAAPRRLRSSRSSAASSAAAPACTPHSKAPHRATRRRRTGSIFNREHPEDGKRTLPRNTRCINPTRRSPRCANPSPGLDGHRGRLARRLCHAIHRTDELLHHQRRQRQGRPISAAWRAPTRIASGWPRGRCRRQDVEGLPQRAGRVRAGQHAGGAGHPRARPHRQGPLVQRQGPVGRKRPDPPAQRQQPEQERPRSTNAATRSRAAATRPTSTTSSPARAPTAPPSHRRPTPRARPGRAAATARRSSATTTSPVRCPTTGRRAGTSRTESAGCSQEALVRTGGAGKFYCFAN